MPTRAKSRRCEPEGLFMGGYRTERPTAATPNSFKSSAVNLGRIVSSISLARNTASYRSRPRLPSHSPRSMMAPL